MRKNLLSLKYLLTIVLFISGFNYLVFAGTTGKISGKVIDSKTKEPLIGANITLKGSNLGAATDLEGNYFIINIPPGKYQLQASLVGYSPYTVSDIKVSADQTSKIDFALKEATMELGSVEILASRPIVQKDLTSTQSNISGDDISMLPIEDVQAVVNLQAGVVDGHFRGGRSGEVKYLIDGVSVNDAFSGESSMEAEINSIQEVQVLSGTFNAEYGEALSGVVNQITKVAGEKYNGNVSFYAGDYLTGHGDIFEHVTDKVSKFDPTKIYNYQGSLSGPVPGVEKFVKFFVSGRYLYEDGYLYGKRMFNPSDSSDFSNNDKSKWYVGNTGDGQYVSMNYQEKLSLQGKLAFKVGNGQGIVLQGLYQKQNYRDYDHAYKLDPDGDYKKHQNSFLGSASYTQVFNNSLFIDFLGSIHTSDYKQYAFEDPFDSRYVTEEKKNQVSGASFLTAGTENWHFQHNTKTITGKVDMTYQLNSIHQIKTGIETDLHTLDYKDYEVLIDASTNYKPTLPAFGSFNFNVYKNHPYQLSAYMQDKIELDYLVVNLGLRYDYFQPDGTVLKNADKIAQLDQLQAPYPDSLVNKATTKSQISPRIGLSYPISDKGAIHISYGHFFQIPAFEYLYKNPNYRIALSGSYPNDIGNVIGNADLKPQQTVMYEIGLQQEIMDNIGASVTAYYKDIRNLLAMEIHIKNDFKKFAKYVNLDYGAVSGFTISFDKKFSDGFAASVDYTYQVAKGDASDPEDAYNKASASPAIDANKQLVPLNWDRTHSLNFTVTYGTVNDFIISTVGQLGSGLPYTPSLQNQRTGLENSDNKPAFFNVDLFITKYFKVYGTDLSIFAKVYNLFDTANESDVFGDTGRAGYTLELTRAQSEPRGVNTLKEYYTRADFYSAPRQVVFGASLGF
jgi:outer membrane receptor protein involved in Fe transport